jgi:hypothetical protein
VPCSNRLIFDEPERILKYFNKFKVIYLYGTLQREGVLYYLFCNMANKEYDEEKDVVKDEGSVDKHQSQPAKKGVIVISISVPDPALIFE